MNSEEHDNAEGEATIWTRNIPKEILEKVSEGKEVSAERITVWIDPLDATQEYTGLDMVVYSEMNSLAAFTHPNVVSNMFYLFYCV